MRTPVASTVLRLSAETGGWATASTDGSAGRIAWPEIAEAAGSAKGSVVAVSARSDRRLEGEGARSSGLRTSQPAATPIAMSRPNQTSASVSAPSPSYHSPSPEPQILECHRNPSVSGALQHLCSSEWKRQCRRHSRGTGQPRPRGRPAAPQLPA